MQARLTAFVACTDLDRARDFYVRRLGLALRATTPYGLVLDGGGCDLRVTLVAAVAGADYTVLGWDVDDLDAAIDDLVAAGVAFQDYDGMEQDDRLAWQAPDGSRVAWFRDPDGNTLSLHQPAARSSQART